jgi:hypothetical protein
MMSVTLCHAMTCEGNNFPTYELNELFPLRNMSPCHMRHRLQASKEINDRGVHLGRLLLLYPMPSAKYQQRAFQTRNRFRQLLYRVSEKSYG